MEEKNEIQSYIQQDTLSKANLIINSKFKSTLQAQRIMYINMFKIQNNQYYEDPNTKEIVVESYASEIAKLIGLKKGGSLYKSLDAVARQMVTTSIGFTDP